MRERRKLAAILAIDAVGYSRLMGRDESGTLGRLKSHRAERLEPALARHGGRLVKLTGDGALAEFGSAVNAVRAAIEFQQAMLDANRDAPTDQPIRFRVGLHVGDVIVDGDDDLYGEGVNIAARLEAAAPEGGIIVSNAVREAVEGRLKARLHDLGALDLKNIDRPVRAFRVEWEAGDWPVSKSASPGADATKTIEPSDRPSIAVLPFQNVSGDAEHEYFVDGVTEDIITDLSRFHSILVIARNSSFSYKGKSPDIRQVGRELGVRYVVEGSLRRAGQRVRVTSQLADTLTGTQIWAERYDRTLSDIFALQEEITRSIVGAVAPQIEASELSKAARRHPANLGAHDLAVKAWAHQLEGRDKADPVLISQSIREAKEALALDPGNVRALHTLARALGTSVFLQIAPDREQAVRDANWAAARAVELDRADALGYALRGMGVVLSGDLHGYPDALADARRAHAMNPNDAFILRILGDLEAGGGEPEQAIEHLNHVLRLNPRDTHGHLTYSALAFACFAARRYDEGIRWASLALREAPRIPQAHASLVICLVGAGQIEKAKTAFEATSRLSREFFDARLNGRWPYAGLDDRTRATTFMRIAAGLEDNGSD